jgi:hypothetical protein
MNIEKNMSLLDVLEGKDKVQVSLYVSPSLLADIESKRGSLSRNKYILLAIYEKLNKIRV